MGRDVSQLEAPLSWAKSMARCAGNLVTSSGQPMQPPPPGSFSWSSVQILRKFEQQCTHRVLSHWVEIWVANGPAMAVEAAYSCREALVGFTMASPPNLVGRARRSRTVSSGGALPVGGT